MPNSRPTYIDMATSDINSACCAKEMCYYSSFVVLWDNLPDEKNAYANNPLSEMDVTLNESHACIQSMSV